MKKKRKLKITFHMPKGTVKSRRLTKKSVVTIDLRTKQPHKEKKVLFKEEEIGTKNVLFAKDRRGE